MGFVAMPKFNTTKNTKHKIKVKKYVKIFKLIT